MITLSILVALLLVAAALIPNTYATPASTPTDEPETEEPETEPEPEAETETETETEESQDDQEIDPCLLDPSDESCPKPDPETQECPEGWAQNENGDCFPRHDKCPNGFHSHEDDETGRCIPDSTPCEPGFIRDPDFPTCSKKDDVCKKHPEIKACGGKDDDNNNGKDRDRDRDNNKNDKHVDITVIKNENEKNSDELGDIEQTIVAIDYDNGAGINCVIDEDDNGKCETFSVNKDPGKEPLLVIIPFS